MENYFRMLSKVEFYKHNLSARDKSECMKSLNSLFLTTGSVVSEFEKKFSRFTNNEYTVGVTSCTDALFLSLSLFGIKSGDEVITTPMSFIATANVIEYCGARPVFVDIEENTGNINADLIEKAITSRTKAIIVVHLYGHMADMKKIGKIAERYKLKLIEDCAHSIEGKRDGIRPGQLSHVGCFSFYAIKNLTCGEGGAIVCNNSEYYEWLRKARLHGMSKSATERYSKRYEHYDMEFLGYKCNMSNISASLLIHQMDRLEKMRKVKDKIAKIYDKGFLNNSGIELPLTLPGTKHARHLYTIWVSPKNRDKYLNAMQEKGVGVAVNFRPIHLMSYYRKKYKYKFNDFPIAEKIGASTITLPFYPKLTQDEIRYVIDTVNEIVK